jgi:hypothetical protein
VEFVVRRHRAFRQQETSQDQLSEQRQGSRDDLLGRGADLDSEVNQKVAQQVAPVHPG